MLRRLSIKSQLLLLLLAVGLGGIGALAIATYTAAGRVRPREILVQLAGLRDAEATRIQDYFDRMRAHLDTLSEDEMILTAMRQFGAAYEDLGTKPLTPAMLAALTKYYTEEFLPRLASTSEGRPELAAYFPVLLQAKILQSFYLLKENRVVSDGTAEYARVHDRLDPVLGRLASAMGYHDLLLISPEGNVVYSTAKRPDLGTSLTVGPYAETSLARVFAAARRHRDRGQIEIADFTRYPPADNKPSAFLGVPLLEGASLLGVLAVELSIDRVNEAMTGHRGWAAEGLGTTGEVYLVGDDFLMRSDSRFLLEEKQEFLEQIRANGVPESVVSDIDHFGTSILLQPVHSEVARLAVGGQTGTGEFTDYRGTAVFAAYRPAGIPGLNWGLVAKRDYADAMAPLLAFKGEVALLCAAFVVVATMISLWMASRFVKPIDALLDGVRQISEGREDVHVDDHAGDEIGRLARAFNQMVERLRADKEEIRSKNRENESLLLNVLPAPIAQRLKSGEERIADAIPNVTVLFADLNGFGDYSRMSRAEEVVELLNEIVSAFDEAAERHGVERVKTIGSVYMAVSGLSVPRIDHAHRMMAFACDMTDILQAVNQRRGLALELSTGINSGPAIAGIVGRQKFIYDLWGDTVTLAGRMQGASGLGGIRVTQAVKDTLGDLYPFEAGGEFDVPGRGIQRIWSLKTA